MMTPAAVHHGHAEQLRADRARVLAAAYAARPERFIARPPVPPALPPPPGSTSPTTRRSLTKS
jgi:putative transposase